MKRYYSLFISFIFFNMFLLAGCNSGSGSSAPSEEQGAKITHQVELDTSLGTIRLGLYGESAPITVQNFLGYVDSGFYENLIFHRVIEGFIIQGGGFNADFNYPVLNAPIVNESNNRLSNLMGSVAMARVTDPDSAQSQFFINTADNINLDYRPASSNAPVEKFGYTVFGRVLEGMETVKLIEQQPTGELLSFKHLPLEPIVINRIRRIEN